MPQWMIQPRDKNLRRSYDPVKFWSSLTVVERHNVTGTDPGTWSVTARNEGLTGLLTPGNGVLLTRGDKLVMSGPITSIQRGGTVSTISGVSDLDVLDDRILFPDPTKDITNQPTAYDTRSGPAESVLLSYVRFNAGDAALSYRQVPRLRLPATQGRGRSVSIKGRLDLLGAVAADVAESGKLHMDILQREDDAPYLDFTVRPITDRTANVRFGAVRDFTGGIIGEDWSYTLTRPTVTAAIVAGGGQGANRLFVERVSAAAESIWGSRIEALIDQRQTTVVSELTDAGDDALSDGSNPVSVSFTITDSPDVQYRRDWFVGDKVGVFIDGLDLTNLVREVTTTVQAQEGSPTETVSAVVGSRDSSAWTTKTNTRVAKALKSVRLLQAI
ncbi:siphovirus ReqiPepy6 Gp37-like family protein [Curtobacterium sp. MCSS17_011]|uniref:Gp37-like protein n=1 Tax=Curtobacterium sp. MCSS17_011 TaxID=2175643 RepID=UPI0015E89789|nr:siphovirus ReqiPepy6 Gp37-like family protein [Curtobacterium sp. MCSS17_011]